MFVLAPDGTVLHCLPGYWDANDVMRELDLAERLLSVWEDHSIHPEQKRKLFAAEHLRHISAHPRDTADRSELQGFDKLHVFQNRNTLGYAIKNADLLQGADPHYLPAEAFKTTDVIMHERISERPFAAYASFDIPSYVSYGCHHYDKNENEFEPEAATPIRARQLRDVLKETAPPAAAKPESPAPAKAASALQGPRPDITKPKEMGKFMSSGFWRYMMEKDWAKAERVASYMVRHYPDKASGWEMKALVEYEQKRYATACNSAWQAIQLGSKHPRIIELYTKSRNATVVKARKQ